MKDCGSWISDPLTFLGRGSRERETLRVLVIAPHPDDEAIGCAVLLHRIAQMGGKAMVAFLTTGIASEDLVTPDIIDRYGSFSSYCRVRRDEQVRAQELCEYTVVLRETRPSRSLISNMSYLTELLERCILSVAPFSVLCPAYEGAHPDHDVVNCVASYVCRKLGVSVFEYLGYHRDNGIVRFQEFMPRVGSNDKTRLLLSQSEVDFKSRVLRAYASQAGMILNNFKADREDFRRLPSYNYGCPPTRGSTYYEHWGAGLSSEEVCVGLTQFLHTANSGER